MGPPPILHRIHSQLSSIRKNSIRIVPAHYYHGNDHPHLPLLTSCLARSLSVSSRRPSSSSSSPNNRSSSQTSSLTTKSTGISYLDTWMNNPTTTSSTTTTTNGRRLVEPTVVPTAVGVTSASASSRRTTIRDNLYSSPPYQLPSSSVPPSPPPSSPASSISQTLSQTNNSNGHFTPLSSSAYQMFTLRPTRMDTPESLLERLNHQTKQRQQLQQQQHQQQPTTVNKSTSKIIMPIVLDLSDIHFNTGLPHQYESTAPGTLTDFVNAIRSYRNWTTTNSTEQQSIGYSLVGIANLPSDDTFLAEEAQMLNLPLVPSRDDDDDDNNNNPASDDAGPSYAAAGAVFHGRKPAKRTKKKRGGVAPLLRQRRPGVAASSSPSSSSSSAGKSIRGGGMENSSSATTAAAASSSSSSSSTLTTKDDNTSANRTDIQIVGMGKLPHHATSTRQQQQQPSSSTNTTIDPPPPPSYNNNTKVHKGSVRSGQLLSSDRPHQSLVIVGSVNPGGEVWSEGDVYVFGKLRGRVLAGLSDVGGSGSGGGGSGSGSGGAADSGDDGANGEVATQQKEESADSTKTPDGSSSRIFATSFDPELVCIGDVFKTMEDDAAESCGLEEGAGPAMVTVDEDTGELVFERMEL